MTCHGSYCSVGLVTPKIHTKYNKLIENQNVKLAKINVVIQLELRFISCQTFHKNKSQMYWNFITLPTYIIIMCIYNLYIIIRSTVQYSTVFCLLLF